MLQKGLMVQNDVATTDKRGKQALVKSAGHRKGRQTLSAFLLYRLRRLSRMMYYE